MAFTVLLWAGIPPRETLGKCGKCKIVEHLFAQVVPMNIYLSIQQRQTPTKMSTVRNNYKGQLTSRTKMIYGEQHEEYMDTDIMGRVSAQWISTSLLDTENATLEAELVAEEAKKEADNKAWREAKKAAADRAEAMEARIAAMRDTDTATMASVRDILGDYLTTKEHIAYPLSEVVDAIKCNNEPKFNRAIVTC